MCLLMGMGCALPASMTSLTVQPEYFSYAFTTYQPLENSTSLFLLNVHICAKNHIMDRYKTKIIFKIIHVNPNMYNI